MTATRQTLLNLAARVEGLDSPCREVADEVMIACGHTKYCGGEYRGGRYFRWFNGDYSRNSSFDPLSSLDAAMTLVPEGFYWDVAKGVRRANKGPYWASCYNDAMLAEMIDSDPVIPGNTPALALTAASLRARAAMMEE